MILIRNCLPRNAFHVLCFVQDIPAFLPVARHAKNRALREELYRKYVTVASEGDASNEPVIEKMLTLRQEKANLLGYPNHAEVSMASKVLHLQVSTLLTFKLNAFALMVTPLCASSLCASSFSQHKQNLMGLVQVI